MQSPSRIVSSGTSFTFLGLVRGRERPRLSVTGTIMFMALVSPLLTPSMSQAGLAVKAGLTMTACGAMRTKGIHEETRHKILSLS
jgi:hypothetical protein